MADQLYLVRIAAEEAYKKAFSDFQKETKKTQNYTETLTKELNFQARAAGKSADEMQLLRAELRGASADQLKALQAAQAYNRASQIQASQNKKLTQSFRFMRGGLGQVGHQIQDVAVQAQMGTNAMIIFGQQGSQVASLFGPSGALLGAIIAVGAAISMAFIPSVKEAQKDTKTLGERINALDLEFKDLTESQQKYLINLNRIKQSKIEDDIKRQEDAIKSLNERLEKNSQTVDNNRKVTSGNVNVLRAVVTSSSIATESINRHSEAHDNLVVSLDTLKAELDKNKQALIDLKSPSEELTDSYEDSLVALQNQLSALSMTNEELFIQEQLAKGATAAQLGQAAAIYELIRAKKEELKLSKGKNKTESTDKPSNNKKQIDLGIERIRKSQLSEIQLISEKFAAERELIDTAKDQKGADVVFLDQLLKESNKKELEAKQNHNKLIEAEQKRHNDAIAEAEEKAKADKQALELQKQQLALATVSAYGSMATQIASAMEEGSGAQKAMFLVSKGLAFAEAIMSANLAYNKTIAQFGAAGVPMAEAVRAAGYVNAGMIAGQAIASFEGGGLTGSGVRSGGMDGKGGRIAVVHPNEKIIDLHKGQSKTSNVNVSFNIQANDTRGFDELLQSRRGQIVSMINRAINDRGRSSLA